MGTAKRRMELGFSTHYCEKKCYESKARAEGEIKFQRHLHPTKRFRVYFCLVHKAYHLTTNENGDKWS